MVAPPLAVLLAAMLAAVVTTIVSVRSLTDAPGAVEAGRSRTAVSAGLAVLAVIAAAVTLWRFVVFSSSSALLDGAGGVDPAGVVVAMTTTDESGEYAFAELPEGEYTVIASGYPPVSSRRSVKAGVDEVHDVLLEHSEL